MYCTRTKFRGINFHALARSEFRGSIFSCGVIFVDTRCSRSKINFQLRSYIRNVKFIRISTKMGLFIVSWHIHGLLYFHAYSKLPCTLQQFATLLGLARFPLPLPYTSMHAIRQSLSTWRDHSCNMKLQVADNIFLWRIPWSPKRSDDTSILISWSILTLNLITYRMQRCVKIGRKISRGGLIFVGRGMPRKPQKFVHHEI